MKSLLSLVFLTFLTAADSAYAETHAPKLIVAISVDQFSADLFSEYRNSFSYGFKRLQQGAVFPSGYQSHAATETCPGHSTILTGDRPARTGIIANNWFDLGAKRADKMIYCAEDETVPGSTSDKYVVSVDHLRVPTLGDRMKALDKYSQVVSVAGKDRAAVMMGGHKADRIWWWVGDAFTSFAKAKTPEIITQINARTSKAIADGLPAPALPEQCAIRNSSVPVGEGKAVGGAPPALPPATAKSFRIRPEFDHAVLDIASGLIDTDRLGKGKATDLIAIGLSVTDYVGHSFGTEGAEMCVQLLALDRALGGFFDGLDARGIDYAVVLTADHGGHDLAERNRMRGIADDQRILPDLKIFALNAAIGHVATPAIVGESIAGDLYVIPTIMGADREKVIADAKAWLMERPQVAVALTASEIRAASPSPLPPEEWTLAQRAAASYDAQRSGDLVVLLKPRVIPIANPDRGSVATHGSPWNYDRRVPILFWRQGMTSFEQPNSIETVDIMPTLAALIGLPLKPGDVDGKCRDLDAGAGSTCPAD